MLRLKGDFLGIAFGACCFAVLFACAGSNKEHEPNNSFSNANKVVIGRIVKGYMDSPSDRDLYHIRLDEDANLDLRLSGARGVNLSLKIWRMKNNTPQLIKWIDDNRKSSPEQFVNLAAGPGDWYFEIMQSERDKQIENREDAYEFLVVERKAVSEEAEPNDTKDNANPVPPRAQISGFFSPACNRMNNDREYLHREEDWFVFEADASPDAPFVIGIDVSGVSGVNSVLALRDDDGTIIAQSDSGGDGEPESLRDIGLKKSGRYYIVIASKNYAANQDQPYSLSLTAHAHDPGMETESNDDLYNANLILNNVIAGRINTTADHDFFRYRVDNPGLFRVELRPTDDLDAFMSIHGEGGASPLDINLGGAGGREVYPDYYAASDFTIEISCKGKDRSKKGEYVLTVTPLSIPGAYEREPNDEIAKANTFDTSSMTGYLSHKRDKDFFLIMREGRSKERFDVRGVKGGRMTVSITDPLGYVIKSVDAKGDRKISFTEMIDKKGYLVVEAISEEFDHPYIINMRRTQ